MDQSLTERQCSLLEYLEKMNGDNAESWACYVNLGYALEDGLKLVAAGLAEVDEKMGIPVARLRRKSKLKEVTKDSMGHTLYVEDNEVGGHRYWSDEIGGGVVVWDTCLVSAEMMRLALNAEKASPDQED